MKATLLLVLYFVILAAGSHFRFGHIYYNQTAERTVEFTIIEGWRSTQTGKLCLEVPFEFRTCTDILIRTLLGTFTVSSGSYTLLSSTFSHTFSGTSTTFQVTSIDCCRTTNLVNAGGLNYNMLTDIVLSSSFTSSPIALVPPVLQFPISATASYQMPVSDPQGDSFSCRTSTPVESLIPTIAQIGPNKITVDSDCTIRWNTNGGTVGNLYAVNIALEKSSGIRSSIDFIVELVDPAVAPQCSSDVPSPITLNIGDNFSATFTGTDPVSGENLVLSSVNLPSGSTLTKLGTSSNPFSASFQFSPTTADVYIFIIYFTNSLNVQASCPVSITVNSLEDNPCNDDAVAPVFAQTPSNIVINCSDVIPPPLNLTATDNCPGVTVVFSSISLPNCSGVITRTWIATDNSSNTASVSQNITIVDNNQCVGTCYKCKDTTLTRNIWLTTTSVAYTNATALCQLQGGHVAEITKADFQKPNQLLGKCSIKDAWVITMGNYYSCMVFTKGPIGSLTQQNCNLQKRVICESP
eukprot:TRINITY_DN2509_c0_g1_i3.p1 TRINITY_DN2509_c0_g1~~TRINITY_DN2509_c0_g1_i3.p1  ORF type:complete len:533 (-),score=72.87 TRINITY_DN2509_c0_g1_i3:25-1593(-)